VNSKKPDSSIAAATENIIWGSPVSPSATPLSDNWIFAAYSLPYLQALNQHTRETITLLSGQGNTAVYVEKLDSPEHLRIFSRIGASVPLYCTAVGKFFSPHVAGNSTRFFHKSNQSA